MNEDLEPVDQLFRVDQLAGCGNLFSFAEYLAKHFDRNISSPLSLLSLDINAFSKLNVAKGFDAGDAALRWIGLVLVDETGAPVYRISGDEFVVVLNGAAHAEHAGLGRRVFNRLNDEAPKFGLQVPAASIAIVHYTGEERLLPADVFLQISASLYRVKTDFEKTFNAFYAAEVSPLGDLSSLRWIANLMVERMVSLSAMLDESNRLAHTDPVTGLPNMRAAEQQLARLLARAAAGGQPLSILLIDGDDLKGYNKISYAAGDEMIQHLGAALTEKLRPGDFIARWRVGDEFLVLLPNTTGAQAVSIGKRLCRAVQQIFQEWPLPVTISIGAVDFSPPAPVQILSQSTLMETAKNLVSEAEQANSRAKALGKNRVASAGDSR